MRRANLVLSAVLLAAGFAPDLAASVIVKASVYDGEATSIRLLEAFRQRRREGEAEKVRWVDREVTVTLIETGAAAPAGGARKWDGRTDASGALTIDTGLPSFPEGAYLVASGVTDSGTRVYSPFFRPSTGSQAINLYPTTEDTSQVQGQCVVVYDTQDIDPASKKAASIRVRVRLIAFNRGGHMFVGRRAASPWREVWRIPLPRGARIILNRGPDPAVPGWTPSGDGRWLIADSPVPGVADLDRFGTGGWEVHYLIPATQTLVQTYPMSFDVAGEQFQFWCLVDDMTLAGKNFFEPGSNTSPDPLTGDDKVRFIATGGKSDFRAGQQATMVLTVDNAAIGQISLNAIKWVGGFVLAAVLAILLGLALGARGPSPDAVFAGLSGDEVLDRIADLDARRARGQIPERDFQRHREVLVELAAEELAEEGGAAPQAREPGSRPAAPAIPEAVREILRRIDDIDRNGATDPARIAERAHLLEALAKAIPRDAPKG